MKTKNKKADKSRDENKKGLLSHRQALKINIKAFRLIGSRHPQMIVSRLICSVWEALTPYVGVYISALLIEELSTSRAPKMLVSLAAASLILAALISVGTALLTKWRDTVCAGMYFKVVNIFTDKLLEMDYIDIDNSAVYEKLSTIRQSQNGGGWGLYRVIGSAESVVSALASLAGGVSLTLSLFLSPVPEGAGKLTVLNSPFASVGVVALMLAVTYFAPLLANKAGSYFARGADTHNLGNRLFGYFGGLGYKSELAADMRIYRQDHICDRYNNDKNGIFGSHGMFAMLARGPMGMYAAASAAVSVVFTGIVYAFVCLKAWAGAFGVGAVTQYIASVTMLSGSVSKLISTVGDMRNNASFLSLVFDFLEIPGKMQMGTHKTDVSDSFEIEFRNVSFKYPGSEDFVLKNVDLKLHSGSRMALVGRNGSGKTTFIKLLCRLYDPTEGEILLNGRDIKEYGYREYMDIFSVVFQDFSLFAATLGENVGSGKPYDGEKVSDCLQRAGFGERLKTMPGGNETYLYKDISKEGVDVSGGEAQKIALARALYKDAPFIVLDEPTAALDPIAEAEIYENFNSIIRDKTAVYISHRLSSCRFCDDIMVFSDGQVVQRGSHEELLKKSDGLYRELWDAQAQYYSDAAEASNISEASESAVTADGGETCFANG